MTLKKLISTKNAKFHAIVGKNSFFIFSCVQHHLCEDGEIVTDGGSIFDFRNAFGPSPDVSKCPGIGEVCCRKEEFRGIPVGGTATVRKPSPKCTECEDAG